MVGILCLNKHIGVQRAYDYAADRDPDTEEWLGISPLQLDRHI